ncbi:putative odorant receptor 85d [Atheta coriaria]|uniref:putative odorant receptor 85d n=1 Tax=Dalotia coriaria TaxID=877792 RepID=UPI0031F34ABA
MKYANILDISFFSLGINRQRPHDNPKIANAICIFWLIAAVFYCTLSTMLLFHLNGDVDLLAKTMEGMTTFLQMFIKSTPLLLHRKRFLKLYEQHKTFWNPDLFPETLQKKLEIINYVLEHLDINDPKYLSKFRKCMEHHKFILSFTAEMLSILSIPLLGQYILSIYLSCMELYLFADSLGSPERFILSVFYVLCLYVQFALYCFPATEYTAEAERLATAIYSSSWYNGPVSLQKNVGFVIQRAQKEFKFMAAGLAEINCEAFVVVFKTSLSFYTLMRQMKENVDG